MLPSSRYVRPASSGLFLPHVSPLCPLRGYAPPGTSCDLSGRSLDQSLSPLFTRLLDYASRRRPFLRTVLSSRWT